MKLFFDDFESIGQYHDHWASVILCAPDSFRSVDDSPVNQKDALREAFDVLRTGFKFVERKEKDPRKQRIMRELIEMSYEAYVAGENKIAAHTLGECEGLIWPSRAQRIKYAVSAEQRVFGELVTYASVKISPYPYEGTESDLSPGMKQLYVAARARCLAHFAKQEDFKPFVLMLEASGSIRENKSRSWKAAKAEIQSLSRGDEIHAFARTEVVVSGKSGVLIHDIEAKGSPLVSVRSLVSNYICEAPQFHLDELRVLQHDA